MTLSGDLGRVIMRKSVFVGVRANCPPEVLICHLVYFFFAGDEHCHAITFVSNSDSVDNRGYQDL
jgi:hypothetical protein